MNRRDFIKTTCMAGVATFIPIGVFRDDPEAPQIDVKKPSAIKSVSSRTLLEEDIFAHNLVAQSGVGKQLHDKGYYRTSIVGLGSPSVFVSS